MMEDKAEHTESHEGQGACGKRTGPGCECYREKKGEDSKTCTLCTQSIPSEAVEVAQSDEGTYNPLNFFDRTQSARPLPMFERRNSAAAADASMALIMKLKAELAEMDRKASITLQDSQNVIDACGDAIAAWFKGLSGAALERAIKEAFQKFDSDGSGLLDEEEYAKSMHVLGLRLSKSEYKILFDEHDIDGSGTIDLEEFTHMVRMYLKLPCSEEDCVSCAMTDPDNQPHTICRKNWADDETILESVASVIQKHVRSALIREEMGFSAVSRMRNGDGEGDRVEEEKKRREVLEKMGQTQDSEERRNEERGEARKRQEEKLREREERKNYGEKREEFEEGLDPDWKSEETGGEEREGKVVVGGGWGDSDATNEQNEGMQEREINLIESTKTETEQESKDQAKNNSAMLRGWKEGGGNDIFGRLSSARDGPTEQLLSYEEVQQARHTTDDGNSLTSTDSFDSLRDKLKDKLRLKTHEVATRKKLQGGGLWCDLQLNNASQRHDNGWQGPNQNLNHDSDESIFRGGMRIFLSQGRPEGRESLDQDSFHRTRSQQVHDIHGAKTVAMIDPWPRHLPPLAHGTYVPRGAKVVINDRAHEITSSHQKHRFTVSLVTFEPSKEEFKLDLNSSKTATDEFRRAKSCGEHLFPSGDGFKRVIPPGTDGFKRVISVTSPGNPLSPADSRESGASKGSSPRKVSKPRRSVGEQMLLKSLRAQVSNFTPSMPAHTVPGTRFPLQTSSSAQPPVHLPGLKDAPPHTNFLPIGTKWWQNEQGSRFTGASSFPGSSSLLSSRSTKRSQNVALVDLRG